MKVLIDGKEYVEKEDKWTFGLNTIILDGKKYVEAAKDVEKEEEIIYAPDFVTSSRIMFNDYSQLLYGIDKKRYGVKKGWKPHAKYKLIPIKREDLKSGDVAFKTDEEDFKYKDSVSYYCIILDDEKYVLVSSDERSSLVAAYEWKFWYKVVVV